MFDMKTRLYCLQSAAALPFGSKVKVMETAVKDELDERN